MLSRAALFTAFSTTTRSSQSSRSITSSAAASTLERREATAEMEQPILLPNGVPVSSVAHPPDVPSWASQVDLPMPRKGPCRGVCVPILDPLFDYVELHLTKLSTAA